VVKRSSSWTALTRSTPAFRSAIGGGGHDLDLSNGGTDVFLSVLQFALSDLAEDPCGFEDSS
jgi:hypothetical protein